MINLKLIDTAIRNVESTEDDNDSRRLAFFRDIWQAWFDTDKDLDLSINVNADNLKECIDNSTPYISEYPIEISRDEYISTLDSITKVIISNENAGDDLKAALKDVDWKDAINSLSDESFALSGKCPEGLIKALGDNEEISDAILIVAALALRPYLGKVADAVKPEYETLNIKANHPVACPVCGSRASVARVGKTKHSQGRGKELYCQTCGFTWDFERVRCAVCGTRNQQKLHYFNVEGDDAHRIAKCDECGEYTRTVYQDEELAVFSFEVEDVLLAKLDAVAQTFCE
jgi:FdhE protein